MDATGGGGLLPGEPPCVFCELEVDHKHQHGRSPITPCRPCMDLNHDACISDPHWCGCLVVDCIGRLT